MAILETELLNTRSCLLDDLLSNSFVKLCKKSMISNNNITQATNQILTRRDAELSYLKNYVKDCLKYTDILIWLSGKNLFKF